LYRLRHFGPKMFPHRCRETHPYGAPREFARYSPECVEGEFSEVRVWRVIRPSLLEQTDPHQAALKNTMADAPTTTTTNTSIRMAGSSTTSSALPVVVACISRIPTVAR
jgi:hypothetical protein